MSEFYAVWINQMAVRDAAVERMAVMALAVILTWVLVDVQIPVKYRRDIRWLYLVGGIAMYAVTMAVAVWG